MCTLIWWEDCVCACFQSPRHIQADTGFFFRFRKRLFPSNLGLSLFHRSQITPTSLSRQLLESRQKKQPGPRHALSAERNKNSIHSSGDKLRSEWFRYVSNCSQGRWGGGRGGGGGCCGGMSLCESVIGSLLSRVACIYQLRCVYVNSSMFACECVCVCVCKATYTGLGWPFCRPR